MTYKIIKKGPRLHDPPSELPKGPFQKVNFRRDVIKRFMLDHQFKCSLAKLPI